MILQHLLKTHLPFAHMIVVISGDTQRWLTVLDSHADGVELGTRDCLEITR